MFNKQKQSFSVSNQATKENNFKYFQIRNYDENFVPIQLVASIVLFIMSIYVYIFGYKTSFEDPIGTMKNNFLLFQIFCIGLALFSLWLATFFSVKKENLAQLLLIIATIFTLVLCFHFGLKIYLDSVYVDTTFSEFYTTHEEPKISQVNTKNLSKQQLIKVRVLATQQRQKYVEESLYAYKNFKLKVTINIAVEIAVVLLCIFLMYRIETKAKKKEEFNRVDDIFYNK